MLRGIHLQAGQAKLVRCTRGRIWDVAVDLRPDSPTYRRWEGYELDDRTHRQLLIPDGFGHGFCVLSDEADVVYLLSDLLRPRARDRHRLGRPRDRDRVADQRTRSSPSATVGAPRLAELGDRT